MPRHTRTLVSVLLGVCLVWFLFRNTDWQTLGTSLRQVHTGWLGLALAMSFGSCFTRVQRWSYVVRASYPASFRDMFSATQIGMLVNCVVPAQLGEVVRAYVLASRAKIPLTGSLTLVALDRINDIFALAVVLLIALLAFPKDTDIEFAAGAFGNSEAFTISSSLIEPVAIGLIVILAVVILILLVLYFKQDSVLGALDKITRPIWPRLANWLRDFLSNIAAGMHIFRSARQMAKSVLFSLLTWGMVALSLAALLSAFHLAFPWYAPILLLAILGLLTSVIVTPGLVGQYHVAVVAGLLMMFPLIDFNHAKAVAIVAHGVALTPPIILGIYCLAREKLNMRELIRS